MRSHDNRYSFLLSVLIGLTAATLAGATTYNCSTFSVPGATSSTVSGINNSGVLAGSYIANSVTHGFISNVSAGSFQTVDYPGSTNTQLLTINNNGVSTGEYNFGIQGQAPGWFTLDSIGTFKTVTVSSPYFLTSIYGINDNGAISAVVGMNGIGPPEFSFAILNPDGTLTLVPGYGGGNNIGSGQTLPGSINNSSQMLESDQTYGATALANATGNVTKIAFPAGFQIHTYAFGLNNPGMVVGYYSSITEGPFLGFSRDASGVYSQVFCPGIPVGDPRSPAWMAINDNGVLAGATSGFVSSTVNYVATPVPGQAQVTLSSNSLTFPPTPVGQTTAPQGVTLTNTGNARLDIAGIFPSSSEFQVSGCLDPTTKTASLDSGASCTLTVIAKPSAQGQRTGSIGIQDSAPGSPQMIAASVTGTIPAPACQISSIVAGPPAQVNFTMQDTNTGLKSILLLDSINANVTIPSFASGTTSPVTVNATQTNSGQSSKVDFQVTNVAGGATTCGTTFGGPSGWIGLGNTFTGKISLITNQNGTLQAFVRGTDNALWTIAQTSPDGGWSSWQSLGGVITTDPGVALNTDGRLEAFAAGSDGQLWHIWQTSAGGSWSGWDPLGGSSTSDPAVVTNKDGRLEVFVLGTEHGLWHIWQTSAGGSWSNWDFLGGTILSNPGVVVNADGRLEAFVVGSDNALWHNAQIAVNSGWSGWASLGGSLAGDPAAVVNQDGHLEVFSQGTDSQLWHAWQTSAGGTWSDFSALGGVLAGGPAVAMNSDGRLEALVRGSDNALWHIAQVAVNSDWGGWSTLGGTLANGPSAATNLDGRMEAFVEGADQGLWYNEQTGPGFWQ